MSRSIIDFSMSEEATVHLWLAAHDEVSPSQMEQYRSWLTAAENARFANFLSERRRQEFIVGRALARLALSTLCGATPECIEFEPDANGKLLSVSPNECKGLHFSISHTSDVVVCAACRNCSVGVDIERISTRSEPLTLSERFFRNSEHAVLVELAESARLDRFFLMWTLKEALGKAHGLGVLTGTDTTHFDMPDQGTLEALSWEPQFQQAWLATAAPGGHHRLALCVLCEEAATVSVKVERDQTGWAQRTGALSWLVGRLRNR